MTLLVGSSDFEKCFEDCGVQGASETRRIPLQGKQNFHGLGLAAL
jgi:hypothetical protein